MNKSRLCWTLLLAGLIFPLAHAAKPHPVTNAKLTPAVAEMVRWITQKNDNAAYPFAVIDKKEATLYIFNAQRALQASSPVLLGSAQGDDSVPGIGDRAIKDIKPNERTTPAGRFKTEPGVNAQGEHIVWVDYDAAVSMHSVRATNKAERRLQRLKTADASDNRITYGCINVPTTFFKQVVQPVFGRVDAFVYILPETRSIKTLMH